MIDRKIFQEKWDFLAQKNIFIACSGGVDSMVLVDLMKGISNKITILHVNYNLRDEDSLADEAFVKEYARSKQLVIEVKSVNTNIVLKEQKGNLQETARKIRYDWFEEKLKDENSVLLLGHHRDDQIETFYQNLARKSGILGLSCMLEVHGRCIRPLLEYSKQEIYTYAKDNNVLWREDISNQSNKYNRNKLRNKFLPFLRKEIPDIDESVLILIEVFQQNRQQIEHIIEPILQQLKDDGEILFSVWKKLEIEQQLILLKFLGCSTNQLPELTKLEAAQKGKFILSSSYKIIREEDGFSFKKRNQKLVVPELKVEEINLLPESFTKEVIYLDADKIRGEITLRPWKIKDRIASKGVKGSQLISKIITDAKLPNSKRDGVLVLCDEKEIHWCVGYKIGGNALASEQTRRILKISVANR